MARHGLQVIGLGLVLAAAPCFGEIYKCKDANGKPVYQDSPCDGPAAGYVEQEPNRPASPKTIDNAMPVRPPVVAPVAPMPGSVARPKMGSEPRAMIPAPMPKPLHGPIGPPVTARPPIDTPESRQIEANQQVFMAGIVYMNYRQCAFVFPDIAAKHGANFERWRSENAPAIAKVEASPEFKAMFADPGQLKAARNGQTHEQGDDFAGSAFAPLPVDVAKTPDEAWQRLAAAFRAGDVEKAAACFSYFSRLQYRQGFRRMGPEGLRQAASGFGDFRMLPGARGELAYGELIRRLPDGSAQSSQVTFARDSRTGGWFIKSM